MKVGIVGLPNAGKSTLFNALTRAGAQSGRVPVHDRRPERRDRAGARRAARRGRRTPGHRSAACPSRSSSSTSPGWCAARIRARGSATASSATSARSTRSCTSCAPSRTRQVAHPHGEVDPAADLEVVEAELLLADLETAQRRLEARRRRRGSGDEAHARGGAVADGRGRSSERAAGAARGGLLTSKPALVVANVGEGEAVPPALARARRGRRLRARRGGAGRARPAEADGDAERARPGAARSSEVVRAAYELLGLITFFTAVGGTEVRARSLRRRR